SERHSVTLARQQPLQQQRTRLVVISDKDGSRKSHVVPPVQDEDRQVSYIVLEALPGPRAWRPPFGRLPVTRKCYGLDYCRSVSTRRGTFMFALILAGALGLPELSTKETARIREAATVLKEIHSVPDKDIPQELWDRAECVIVVPGLKKAAFVIGG